MVSVIVPVYDSEDTIGSCITSIMNQSYTDIEVILVEGGSKDNSRHICEEYAIKYERVIYVNEPNQGVSHARNVGIKHAKGEYITFVDSDDTIESDMIKIMMEVLEASNSSICICGYRSVIDRLQSDYIGYDEARCEVLSCTSNEYILKYLLEAGGGRCWGILYGKIAIDNILFLENITIGEDMIFLIDVLLHIDRIDIVRYKGYNYYVNPKGAMERPYRESYMDQIRCWELAKERLADDYPMLEDNLNAKLMIGAMLVATKIARIPRVDTRDYREELKRISAIIDSLRYNAKLGKLITIGYRIKRLIYGISPWLYIRLYSMIKNR